MTPPPIYKISDVVNRGYEVYANRPAVVYRKHGRGDPIHVSYRQLYEEVMAVREILLRLELGGEKIAVVGENSYQWMLSYLAVTHDVSIVCPLDALLTGYEKMQLIKRSNSIAVFADISSLNDLIPHLGDCRHVQYWIAMNADAEADQDILRSFNEAIEASGSKLLYMEKIITEGLSLLAEEEASEGIPFTNEELAVLLFTSGTTANSKAVMLSHANIAADIRALLETVTFVDPLKSLSILPLHHTFENTCGFLCMLTLGGCIHITDGLRHVGKNIKEYGVHIIIGVPKIFEAIHRRILSTLKRTGQEKKFNFARKISRFLFRLGIDIRRKIFKEVLKELGGEFYIAICGAAPIDKAVLDFFYDLGIEILQGFGLTETAPVVAGCNTQYNIRGSCGQPLSGVQIAIDSDVQGEPGEILIRGDMVCLGYFEDEEENRIAFREDGWFNTGDVGYIEQKKQVLYLTGRTKSMIVLPSGKKVFPEELESLLNENDYIKDSLIFGQNEANGDIVLTAKVVLDEDKMREDDVSPDRVKDILASYIGSINKILPSFKGIRSYAYSFQDMIKTTTLKVKRNVETERILDLIQRAKFGWRDLIGINLDELEDYLEEKERKGENAGRDEEVPEISKNSKNTDSPPRQFSSLDTKDLLEEKVSCISDYDISYKKLKREFDNDMLILGLKKSQKEDVLHIREAEERRALQADYQKAVKELHDRYSAEIIKLRAETEAEVVERTESFQKTASDLNKGIYVDIKEIHSFLPEKGSWTPEFKKELSAMRQKLQKELSQNKKTDKQERRRFKLNLRESSKPFLEKVSERKKEYKDSYRKQNKLLKEQLAEDKNKFVELEKELQKPLLLSKDRIKALEAEQREVLQNFRKMNKDYE